MMVETNLEAVRVERALEECGWGNITATDLWRRAQLYGVPASSLLP